MKVLGISPLDKDSTVSVVEDGNVLFAAGEERFSRTKQQSGFPRLALQKALEYTGLSMEDFDMVCYPFLTWENEQKLYTRNLEEERQFIRSFQPGDLSRQVKEAMTRVPDRNEPIHGLEHPNATMEKGFLHSSYYSMAGVQKLASNNAALKGSRQWGELATESFQHWQQDLEQGLRDVGWEQPVKRMDHHLSHAANSFYCSGFDEALCVTLDGYGTGLAGSVSEARDGRIHRLHGLPFPNSLGTMYEHVTSSLGFKPSRHEGKIVGLASYGDPSILADVLLSRIDQTPGDFRIYESNNVYFSRYLASKFPKIDVAAAYQYVLEKVATDYIRYWVEKTGMDTVVLSGGVTANVKLNQRIFEIEGVRRIFVYPNMGDGGCGTGAALYHSWPGGAKPSIANAYFGPDYGESEMAAALAAEELDYRRPDNLAAEVAALIHDGKVVARFDGRMEYGPRALGNRSILYHAREPEVNQWLNQRLGRTEFMPFAPVTLWEERERCYHNIEGAEHAAEFMTITFDCTEFMKQNCPAAVHVDGTARPQLVRREVNPGYYDILKEYQKLSGIPSLINTSFNMHEEPIVNSPHDAVRAFLQGTLDYLAIGPFLVKHPNPTH
ncbi:carbamoyltransferase family protein [Marinobacter xestospongiae]|uniref:Carbamoyltransferase C-terminal domain-containing protein n=1 Tax=Marinobacter xestospongiae TaxID=994319 RepID=A0ABU3VZL0_9GAMM|nr:carbamoyltransferase C-terminal domain-containing protein [Marinobacter xestospongiae]MDV2079722.1 carbamoyltransferase C-terminal domain-containing protein [Marinobacter xestospongiae]